MELRDVLKVLKKYHKIIVLLPLISIITAAVLSFYVLPPIYEASTTLILSKNESKNTLVDLNTIMANKQLAKTYGEIAKSRTVLNEVIEEAYIRMDVEKLQKQIEVEPVGDTELIRISVFDKDPDTAKMIANITAQVFKNRVRTLMKMDNVKVVDPAVKPKEPVKPNKVLNVVLAGLVGIMVALGLAFFLDYLDNTIKTTEDISHYLGLPVLGTIPKITEL